MIECLVFALKLSETKLLKRKLTMYKFNERGFVLSPDEDAIIFSTRRAGTVASDIAITHSLMNRVVFEDLQSDHSSILRQALVEGSLTENAGFHPLPEQLGMTDQGAQRQASTQKYMQRPSEANAVRAVHEKRQAGKIELTWGLSRQELSKRYIGLQRTLLPMPSGLESPGQVLTGPPLMPLAEYHSSIVRHFTSAPRGPPQYVKTSCKFPHYIPECITDGLQFVLVSTSGT